MGTTTPASITFRLGNDLSLDDVIDVYVRSTLGERRPVDDRMRMAQMLETANLVVTAWDGDKLVGIARCLTDFAYATYLSDLAVDLEYQKQGIGRELVRQVQQAVDPRSNVILLAAPAATDYYPRIGMTQHPSAWFIRGDEPLT